MATSEGRGGAGGNGKGKKGGLSATPSVRDCANCGAPEGSIPGSPTHSACSRCKITYYCSSKCQKQHWKTGGHKQRCNSPGERTVANAMSTGAAEALATLPRCAKQSTRASTVFKPSPDYRCPICLETAEGGLHSLVEKLPCSHEYHVECLSDARKTMGKSFWKAGCGICRSPYGDCVAVSDDFTAALGVTFNILSGTNDEFAMKKWGFHLKPVQERAVKFLRGFSQKGHRLSKLLLGSLLLEGARRGARFIEKREAEGQSLLREAAGDGCATAADQLALHLIESEETFDEGIAILRDLAEFGRRFSQEKLAHLLADPGSLIPHYVDYAEALYWYTRVVVDHAHQSNDAASAAFNATIMLDGKHPGVAVDMALKRRMQDIAVDLMHASAMLNKTTALLHGDDGRERDPLAAYQLAKRLATAPENKKNGNLSEVDRLEGMVKCGQIWNTAMEEGWLALLPGLEDEAVEFLRRAVLESTGLRGHPLELGRVLLISVAKHGKGRYREADSMSEVYPITAALASEPGFGDMFIGNRVELRGLSSKKHRKLKLNGCHGAVVETDFTSLPPIFRVKLDDGRGPFTIPFASCIGSWDEI